MRERGGSMKKTKHPIRFHDVTGLNEVRIIPFIIKTLVCVFALIGMISYALYLPSDIKLDAKYSGKEYYLTRCEDYYDELDFEQLYSMLHIYDLYDEQLYGKYWEAISAYQDYALFRSYTAVVEQGTPQVSIEIPANEDEYRKALTIEYDAKALSRTYYEKVMSNARNVQYDENLGLLTEFAAKIEGDYPVQTQ